MTQIQANLASVESEVNSRQVTGQAGGGIVTATASGEFSFDRIRIDPSVVNASDVALLEDLVLAAVRDAASKLIELRRNAMGGAVSEALGGLFGAAPAPEIEPTSDGGGS
jgi:DNA-binding YbaB/EbfC family protein